MSTQLPLPLRNSTEAEFDAFVTGGERVNAEACAALCADHLQVVLTGAEGAGKTHLLRAACNATANTIFVDCQDLDTPIILNHIQAELVCVDNIDAVLGERESETPLFNLINQQRGNGHRLVLAMRPVLDVSGVVMPDLKSRLAWGLQFDLQVLRDEAAAEALSIHAKRLGLELEDKVASYLAMHVTRTLPELLGCLARLEREAISHKRRITIPLVKQTFAEKGL